MARRNLILWMFALLCAACSLPAACQTAPDSSEQVTVQRESSLPVLPSGSRFKLVWSDEFDGETLDVSKWHNIELGPRRDGYWSPEAAKLDGKGHLVMSTFERDGKYYSGEIDTQGIFEKTYGYFVARVELQKQPGHWSAFWLMPRDICDNKKRGEDGAEIDIFEKIDQSDTVLHNLHWDCYCGIFCDAGKKVTRPGVMEGFHEYAVLWTSDAYAFFVDGKETWRTNAGGVCRVPLYLLLSAEVGKWAGDIKEAKLPDAFTVDYVRVYDIVKE